MKKVKLEDLCKQVRKELEERDYSASYIQGAIVAWLKLEKWCTDEQRQDITPALCNRYLGETYPISQNLILSGSDFFLFIHHKELKRLLCNVIEHRSSEIRQNWGNCSNVNEHVFAPLYFRCTRMQR